MVEELDTGRPAAQIVWGSIWVDKRGRVRRSLLVIIERDSTALRHGYTAWSYCRALKKGLLRNYYVGELF